MKIIIILFLASFVISSCEKKENPPNSKPENISHDTGRLGITLEKATTLWGTPKPTKEVVSPATEAYLFHQGDFSIGVQIWNGKVAQIRISKNMQPLTSEETLALCKKIAGEGDWDIKYGKCETDTATLQVLLPNKFFRFRTQAFQTAAELAEKKQKTQAIDSL